MALSDITTASVVIAVEEARSLGRAAFLDKYGFGRSTRYYLRYEGEEYDSKAIVGAAHGYAVPSEGPLPAAKFSGGVSAATPVLEALGFEIVDEPPVQNPDWTLDELILATQFYKQHARKIPGKTDSRLIALSDEIRAVALSLGLSGNDTFRNPNGVYMKLMELRKYDPIYEGKGLGRAPRPVELDAWNLSDEELTKAATAIREVLGSIRMGTTPLLSLTQLGEPEVVEAAEGALLTRLHRYRERDRKIVSEKKKQFMKKHGRLYCEACGFDFETTYGERGVGFIECHHTLPVSGMAPGSKTKLADLAMVCANCHRIIHAKRPWLAVEEIRKMVRK